MSSQDSSANATFTWGTVVILIFTALLWMMFPSTIKMSIWTLMVILFGVFYVAGATWWYVFRLQSYIVVSPTSKDSINYARPIVTLRGQRAVKGIEVWGQHGLSHPWFAWKDSRYVLFSKALAPRRLAPRSKTFITSASIQPVTDNILHGNFPSVREELMSNSQSFYKPNRPLGVSVGMMHYRETDYEKAQTVASAMAKGGLITPARRITAAPEDEAIRIMRRMEHETKKKTMKETIKELLLGSKDKDPATDDEARETERGQEGLSQ